MSRPKLTEKERLQIFLEKPLPAGFKATKKFVYEGRRIRFGVKCPEGHLFYGEYHSIVSRGCTVCDPDLRSRRFAAHNEGVFTKLLSRHAGYEFDLDEWPPKGPVQITCPSGHVFTRKGLRRNETVRCAACETQNASRSYLEKGVAKFAKVVSFTSNTDCTFECKKCGHVYKHGDAGNSKQRRCPKCYVTPTKLSLTDWNRRYRNAGIGLEIIDHSPELGFTVKCVKGHSYAVQYLGNYSKCSMCAPPEGRRYSNPHQKLVGWLRKQGVQLEVNKRRVVDQPIEVDIVIEDKKFAIEVDGIYFHNEQRGENAQRRLLRRQLLEDAGYRLFRFWDTELRNPRPLLAYLSSSLGLSKKTVGARKCTVKKVAPTECNAFLDRWHLQGSCGSSERYGLYYEGALLAVMTFGRPRMNKNYEWEMVRFCVKGGYSVPGGASRLLTAFKREFDPSSLISYADRRYSVGGVYEALGFKLSHITKPGYFYMGPRGVVSRYSAQKHKLKKLLDSFDPESSEHANMIAAGYTRVFDCGQLVYVYGDAAKPRGTKHPVVKDVYYGRRREPLDLNAHRAFLSNLQLRTELSSSEVYFNTTYLEYECQRCGHLFKKTPNQLVKNFYSTGNRGCHKCCNRYPLDLFLKDLKVNNPDMKYLSGYTALTSPAKFKYLPTGVVFEANPGGLRGGSIPHRAKKVNRNNG